MTKQNRMTAAQARIELAKAKPKRSKYNNRKTVLDGITFHSAKEAKRYSILKIMEKVGEISELELQPKFRITLNGKKICTYSADFGYCLNGSRVIEDVKGVKTPVYQLKKKLVEAMFNMTITEITE